MQWNVCLSGLDALQMSCNSAMSSSYGCRMTAQSKNMCIFFYQPVCNKPWILYCINPLLYVHSFFPQSSGSGRSRCTFHRLQCSCQNPTSQQSRHFFTSNVIMVYEWKTSHVITVRSWWFMRRTELLKTNQSREQTRKYFNWHKALSCVQY